MTWQGFLLAYVLGAFSVVVVVCVLASLEPMVLDPDHISDTGEAKNEDKTLGQEVEDK